MLIRVNKTTGTRPQTVKYAALSTGAISGVWAYDDDHASMSEPKRRNRIRLTTDKTLVVKPQLDA